MCYEKLIKNNKHIENLLYRTHHSVQKRERVVPSFMLSPDNAFGSISFDNIKSPKSDYKLMSPLGRYSNLKEYFSPKFYKRKSR